MIWSSPMAKWTKKVLLSFKDYKRITFSLLLAILTLGHVQQSMTSIGLWTSTTSTAASSARLTLLSPWNPRRSSPWTPNTRAPPLQVRTSHPYSTQPQGSQRDHACRSGSKQGERFERGPALYCAFLRRRTGQQPSALQQLLLHGGPRRSARQGRCPHLRDDPCQPSQVRTTRQHHMR